MQEGPKTANEFLAGINITPEDVTLSEYHTLTPRVAGVDFEEAGEKWRAGDAAKALRFFLRAIDAYDAGLQEFPRSFDLSYNKWDASLFTLWKAAERHQGSAAV